MHKNQKGPGFFDKSVTVVQENPLEILNKEKSRLETLLKEKQKMGPMVLN